MATSVQSAGSPIASASAKKRGPARPPAARARVYPDLFFITEVPGRSAYLTREYFDVPDEPYMEGWRTGVIVYRDMMRALKAGAYVPVIDILQAASMVWSDTAVRVSAAVPDRRGAAVGFLRSVERAAVGVAQCFDIEAWVDCELRELEAGRRRMAERFAQEKVDFVRRMREGKARKAAEHAQ